MSYLRLMKSIWIMDKVRESNDWAKIQRTNPGGLYDRCVREMDRVSVGCVDLLLGVNVEDSDYAPSAAVLPKAIGRVRSFP